MTWRFSSLLPHRISTQIAALIVLSLLAMHVVMTTAFIFLRPGDRPGPDGAPAQLETLVRLVDATSPDARDNLVTEINAAFPQVGISLTDWSQAGVHGSSDPRLDGLRHILGPDFPVAMAGTVPPGNEPAAGPVAIRLRDGAVLIARMPAWPPPAIGGPVLGTLAFLAISLALLGWWAARSLTLPLRSFAKAAESFSLDDEIAPLPERGPYEIKTAARALNHMHERIRRLVDDRTRMLAAVGHDLRTPITRLRLRSEFIEDENARTQMLRDLDQMNAMVESVLMFLRNGHSEGMVPIDLASSLQTICDQFADMQHAVSYEGPDHVVVCARPDALHRAVSNLIDNAVRYGGGAVVRLTAAPNGAEIAIEDEGPGIPDSQKEAMLEPFVRGDTARGMNDASGFGLGLAIARAVVRKHAGTLTLINREPTGMTAKIALPYGALSGASGARTH